MKASSVIGVVIGMVTIALGATMEGAPVMAVLNPSAMLIVLGGTFGAVMTGTSMGAIKNIPTMFKKSFSAEPPDLNARVTELVSYAEQARRDGLLALDEQLASIEDPYTRKGLQLVVDGTDPDLVADVLEAENDAMRKRHAASTQPFDKAGGYAPTMGIIGTVFGLIHVLSNLSKPETLGPSISAAFIATLLGIASANIVYLPISARLKQLSQEELHFRGMTLEGILAIQAGDNPRVVAEKLMAYVPPGERPTEEEAAAAADAQRAAKAEKPRPRSAMSARRKHKGGHEEEEHENEERWLVSFADMMTLLFCLFMVLFAISSVNTSKFESLQKALENAFSGKILSGGEAVMESGSDKKPNDPAAVPPLPSLTPLQALAESSIAEDEERSRQARGTGLQGAQAAHRRAGREGRPHRQGRDHDPQARPRSSSS